MNFDRQGAINAGYSPEEIDSFLTSQQPKPGMLERLVKSEAIPIGTSAVTGLIGAIPGAVAGGVPGIATGAAAAGGGYLAGQGLRGLIGKALGYSDMPLQQGKSAVPNVTARENTAPLWAAGTDMALGMLPYLKYLSPSRFLGSYEAKLASKVPLGSASDKALEESFGTLRRINPSLVEGLSGSGARRPLEKIVEKEIMTQGRGAIAGGGTYKDILNLRTGAYREGSRSFLQNLLQKAPAETALSGKIGKAYSDVLHQGVPHTILIDKALSMLKTGGTWAKRLAGGGAFEVGRRTLGKLFGEPLNEINPPSAGY